MACPLLGPQINIPALVVFASWCIDLEFFIDDAPRLPLTNGPSFVQLVMNGSAGSAYQKTHDFPIILDDFAGITLPAAPRRRNKEE